MTLGVQRAMGLCGSKSLRPVIHAHPSARSRYAIEAETPGGDSLGGIPEPLSRALPAADDAAAGKKKKKAKKEEDIVATMTNIGDYKEERAPRVKKNKRKGGGGGGGGDIDIDPNDADAMFKNYGAKLKNSAKKKGAPSTVYAATTTFGLDNQKPDVPEVPDDDSMWD